MEEGGWNDEVTDGYKVRAELKWNNLGAGDQGVQGVCVEQLDWRGVPVHEENTSAGEPVICHFINSTGNLVDTDVTFASVVTMDHR